MLLALLLDCLNRKSSKSPLKASVPINLSDGTCSELWIRAITEALQPGTTHLDVYFLGGGRLVEPSALLSLRNTLLLAPKLAGNPVFVRTFATCSLSPFACIAWLVGHERWIAKDARVWIPKVPEAILRGTQRPLQGAPCSTKDGSREELTEHADTEEEEWFSERRSHRRRKANGSECSCDGSSDQCACDKARIFNDLRMIASALNEWFPSWEYADRGISAEELAEMRVIKPEWVFGGASGAPGEVRHVEQAVPDPDASLEALQPETTPLQP